MKNSKFLILVLLLFIPSITNADNQEITFDKFAIINSKGEQITGFQWEDVTFFGDYIKVFEGKTKGFEKEGHYGLIDIYGNIILNTEWDEMTYIEGDTVGICKDGKWGCYDLKEHKIIIPVKYDYIEPFADDICVAYIGTFKYGVSGIPEKGTFYFIDRNNEVIHEGIYGDVSIYKNGIAKINEYVDTSRMTSDQLIEYYKNPKSYWMNVKTHKTYDYESGGIGAKCQDGLLSAYQDGKYGYMDMFGDLVIPCVYDEIPVFDGDRAIAKKDGKYMIIDRKNDTIAMLDYDYVSDLNNGKAYGFTGKIEEGDLPKSGLYCLIDSDGQRVGPLHELVSAEEPQNGVWWVNKDGLYTIIDMTGNYVTNTMWNDINWTTTQNGLTAVSNGDGYGIVDKNGNVIIPYIFDEICNDQRDIFGVKKSQNRHVLWNADWGMSSNELIQHEGNDYVHKTLDGYECLVYTKELFDLTWSVFYYFANDSLVNIVLGRINTDGKTLINDLQQIDKHLSDEYGEPSIQAGQATSNQIDLILHTDSQDVPLFMRGYLAKDANINVLSYINKHKLITQMEYIQYYSEYNAIVLTSEDLESSEVNRTSGSNLMTEERNSNHVINYPLIGKAKNNVNIRKSTSTKSEKIGEYKKEEEVNITGEEYDKQGKLWYVVELKNGKHYYVSADYIDISTY